MAAWKHRAHKAPSGRVRRASVVSIQPASTVTRGIGPHVKVTPLLGSFQLSSGCQNSIRKTFCNSQLESAWTRAGERPCNCNVCLSKRCLTVKGQLSKIKSVTGCRSIMENSFGSDATWEAHNKIIYLRFYFLFFSSIYLRSDFDQRDEETCRRTALRNVC